MTPSILSPHDQVVIPKEIRKAFSSSAQVIVPTIGLYEMASYTTRVAGGAAPDGLLAGFQQRCEFIQENTA